MTTLASFVGFSFAGCLEGVHFRRSMWAWFLLAGTALGGVSFFCDKYQLGRLHFPVPPVQAWLSIYLVVWFEPFVDRLSRLTLGYPQWRVPMCTDVEARHAWRWHWRGR